MKTWTSQESIALSYFILLYLVNRCKRLKWNILLSIALSFLDLRKRNHHITSHHHIMRCPAKDANLPSESAVACNISHLCLHLKKRLSYLLTSLPNSCKISLKCLFSAKPQPWPMQGRYSYEEGAFNFLGRSLAPGIFWTR